MMMDTMRSIQSVIAISIWCLSSTVNTDSFQSPASISKDVVQFSSITVSNECDSTDCNRTCPHRNSFPSYIDLMSDKSNACTDLELEELPPNSNKDAENVFFNGTVNCTSINSTVNPNSEGFFSVSLWVKGNCQSKSLCNLLRYGNVTIAMRNNGTLEISILTDSHNVPIDDSEWFHMTVRYNGVLEVFIDSAHVFEKEERFPGDDILIIGPGGGPSPVDEIAVADARYYSDVLTDREITSTFSGSTKLQDVGQDSECRCPRNAPTILTDTSCSNYNGSIQVLRLNEEGGYVEYLNDGDDATVWKSKSNLGSTTLIFSLQNIFQVVGITLTNLGTISNRTIVQLQLDGKVTQNITFTHLNCGPTENCHSINAINGTTFDIEEDSVSTRDDLSKLLADSVILNLYSSVDMLTQFSVGEVEIHVKCHCMGNDPSCIVNGTNYTCNCGQNTRGLHCDDCVTEYYREDGEFGCNNTCGCNLDGSENNACNQVGGQCVCKYNVNENASRICDTCKFNTINLGSDPINGCTACSCNSNGIQYCDNTGTCVCKNNVKNETGNCESCLQDHYGFGLDSGCLPCGCNRTGANHTQCDGSTGQCACKTNVAGRHCDRCKDGYYGFKANSPLGCEQLCGCNFVGSIEKETCAVSTGKCLCLEPVTNNRQCNPIIERVFPTYGPVAGGTIITIQGSLLGNASTSDLNIYIDDSTENVTFRNSSMITVTNNGNTGAKQSTLSILWFKESLSQRNDQYKFEYRSNPVLKEGQTFYTYASGGCTLSVKGSNNMNSAYQPKIVVHINNMNVQNGCFEPQLNTEIQCKTPNTTQYNVTGKVPFGFIFDGFRTYETLDSRIGELTIVKDPVVTSFPDTFGNTFDTQIEIKGEFPLVEKTCRSDMKVMLGDKECDVTTLSETSIICDPQETFLGANRDEELVVIFGNLHINPGRITFRDFWNTQGFIYIAIGVGFAVFLVVVAIVICCILRRKRRGDKRDSLNMPLHKIANNNDYTDQPAAGVVNPTIATIMPFQLHETSTNDISTKDTTKEFLERLSTDVKRKVKASIVDRSSIKLGNVCTMKGSKTRVINGTFSDGSSKAGDGITIKTLISSYPKTGELPMWLTTGLVECIRMRDLQNENILESSGIVVDEKHVYLLYPETNRTLKDFLSGASHPLTESKGLDVCVQISDGMNFLDGHQIIHKDLAARNCWITTNEIVKISDASFTHDLYPDEYMDQDGLYLPVRWMAPESLRQIGFYHSKSDVWSYGVVMWEVFTTGKYLPYHDIANDYQIQDFVCNQGYRLGKPHDCSNEIFAVIEQCLGANSEDRPNFFLISNNLTEIISPTSPISYVNEIELNQTSSQRDDDFEQTVYQNVQRSLQIPEFSGLDVGRVTRAQIIIVLLYNKYISLFNVSCYPVCLILISSSELLYFLNVFRCFIEIST